jgi:ArsR family metal-binding transcriptional regulator
MENIPLISTFDFKLVSPACHPGADVWSIKIKLDSDISEVLPLLNAELDGANYDHKALCLVWKGQQKKYAFRPTEISVAPLEDREKALAMCQEAVDIVNRAWQRRNEIEPDYTRVELPSMMQIYKALPKDNCGECGFPTCMAYAAAYRSGKAQAADCPFFAAEVTG